MPHSRTILCVLSLALLSGCLKRQGRNDQCQWPDEESRILDLHNATDQGHLRNDAQFAEDLAVRYADRFRRVDGFGEYRQQVAECRGALFANIAALHKVDVQAVALAALQRNRMADFVLVYLPMAILFVLFTYRQCGRIFLRTDSIVSAVVVALITSILVSGCGVLSGEIWALAVETLRIGNGHLSFRTGRIPWSSERIYLFIIALGLYWSVAALRYGRTSTLVPDPLYESYRKPLGLGR